LLENILDGEAGEAVKIVVHLLYTFAKTDLCSHSRRSSAWCGAQYKDWGRVFLSAEYSLKVPS
jgi:hypothetical protein